MTLDGLKKVIKRIEEIRSNFSELSRFHQKVKKAEKAPSFREVYFKEMEKVEDFDKGRIERKEEVPLKMSSSIERIVNRASGIYDIDPDLVMAVISVESNFNPRLVSPKGAMGLMQLMPDTAREMGVSDPFDVEENIMGGVKYLRYLSEKYNGDLELTLAAYNAGPAAVDKYGGIPPYKETQDYVKKVLSIYKGIKLKK
ncbi:MAG: lytic transglycosylase domain-containing protein [Synergistetes bacterium]|nr:lytic transglycosylase domain-containing protein [Synergistota bacterium]MDW8193031.1 lytic transglycosylase domain-containing protein [Synergistota bacterium]